MLLKTFDAEILSKDVGPGRVSALPASQPEPTHGKRVGEHRGLEVDVQAAIEVRSGPAVEPPTSRPVGSHLQRTLPGVGVGADTCAPSRPGHRVDYHLITDDPGVPSLKRRRRSCEAQAPIVLGDERDLKALARPDVTPRNLRRQTPEHG